MNKSDSDLLELISIEADKKEQVYVWEQMNLFLTLRSALFVSPKSIEQFNQASVDRWKLIYENVDVVKSIRALRSDWKLGEDDVATLTNLDNFTMQKVCDLFEQHRSNLNRDVLNPSKSAKIVKNSTKMFKVYFRVAFVVERCKEGCELSSANKNDWCVDLG